MHFRKTFFAIFSVLCYLAGVHCDFCTSQSRIADSCVSNKWFIKKHNFTDLEKMAIANAHDYFRNVTECGDEINYRWDNHLAYLAQRWANQCPENDQTDNCRSIDKFNSPIYQRFADGHVYQKVYTYFEEDNLLDEYYSTNPADIKLQETNFEFLTNVIDTWASQVKRPCLVKTDCGRFMNRIGCGIIERRSNHSFKIHFTTSQFVIKHLVKSKIHVVCNYAAVY